MATARIDAHHHLWRYDAAEYGWIDERMSRLRRDFLPGDLEQEMRAAGVDGAVAVQARQTLEETRWLLALAEEHAVLRGVVGWAPMVSEQFPAMVEALAAHPKLKGLRHIVQDEPDEQYIHRPEFHRGLDALQGSGLVYDILIYERQLPAAIACVDRHPNQVFVLDHLAKPKIRAGEMEPWRTQIRELARRQNVFCKLSGLVTEAEWSTWSEDRLRAYVDVALEAFGPQRMVFGSDWPVCLLASSYQRWFAAVRGWIAALSGDEQGAILGGTATQVYGLRE